MKRFKLLLAAACVFASTQAMAGPATDALSACLADNTTGKDRKDLVRWIFSAMAAHPQMAELSNVSSGKREEIMVAAGRMMTRLIGEACAAQTRAAVRQDGSVAVSKAFEEIGRLAMQELMTNPKVAASLSGLDQYVDRKKIEAAMTTN
jgi:hypothetical protein